MKKLFPILCLVLPACDVIVPDQDNTPPELTISMFDPDVVVIASSDPNRVLPRGCPPGTSTTPALVRAHLEQTDTAYIPPLDAAFLANETYFYKADGDKLRFWFIARDNEGVNSISAIGHSHDPDAPNAYEFQARGDIEDIQDLGDYEQGPSTTQEIVLNSPYLPITPANQPGLDFRSNLGDLPVFVHNLRAPEFDIDGAPATKDGLLLPVDPISLIGGPVIYASSVSASDGPENQGTEVAVNLLPRFLCRPDPD